MKLSVLMSVYREPADYIKKSIESVLKQSFKDFEFIIVLDGSPEKTMKNIKSFKDKRIKLINQKNKGLTKSLNIGLKECKGKYLARMDADDIAEKDRFEKQISFLEENKEYAAIGTAVKIINEAGKVIGEFKPKTDYSEIRKNLIYGNLFIHPSLMFRSEIIKKYAYDEEFELAQDYELMLRITAKHKVTNLKEELLKYRRSKEQLSYKKVKKSLRFAHKARMKAIRRGDYKFNAKIFLIWLRIYVPEKIKEKFA